MPINPIPKTENPLVFRTDFSNQVVWETIRAMVLQPVGVFRFRANVEFIDDKEYADISKDQLLGLVPKNRHTFIIIVDQAAISLPDHPLLIVDLYQGSGRAFRAIPSQIQAIENNLSLANMDFKEFADAVDEDGVFRGFSRR